ncbi:MAG TPA: ParA family protein [Mycobacteriales bacterium]|nr:ParA family protein [Mycobacteriales bacterium]
MKVLASFAVKGGVGKTSAAVNLAWLAARDGRRTLLWDLDPQASATFLLRGKAKVKGGARKVLLGKSEATRAIRSTGYDRLDLLPSNPGYVDAAVDLAGAGGSEQRIGRVLKSLRADFDLVVLDCPAGLSVVAANIARASDLLLVPIVPSPLSLRTLDQTVDFIAAHEATPDILIFLSMVERRRALHRDVVGLLQGRYANVAETVIATSAVVERMGQRRCPLGASTPTSAAAAAYEALWREVSERLRSSQPSVAAG